MNNLRQYEKDESLAVRAIEDKLYALYDSCGGRDLRPLRKALLHCVNTLEAALTREEKGRNGHQE